MEQEGFRLDNGALLPSSYLLSPILKCTNKKYMQGCRIKVKKFLDLLPIHQL